jgi:hypothetical protein
VTVSVIVTVAVEAGQLPAGVLGPTVVVGADGAGAKG